MAQQLDGLLRALSAAVPALSKSTGFGQLLMALLKAHGGVLSGTQVAALQAVAAGSASFLSKALAAKLAALAAQLAPGGGG